MADKKITDLTLISAVTASLNLIGDNTLQTYRFTIAQVYTFFKTYLREAGVVTLGSGVQLKAVVFATAMPDALYSIDFDFQNTTDTELQYLTGIVTSKSASGFTISFNAPTDTANYSMNWKAGY